MESLRLRRERGQILVTVALMAVAIFAFVALAVDVGQIYGGRRQMQNAADAAAFAGAQQICYTEWTNITEAHYNAREAAIDYAVNRNGAFTATVEFAPDDYTVDVVATQILNTFFAGVIGIETATVRAEAAAMCSGSQGAGGLWPLAFNQEVYTETIGCNTEFLVFASKDDTGPDLNCAHDCCDCANQKIFDGDECEGYDWDEHCDGRCICDSMGVHIRTADRGWLMFPDPGAEERDDCKDQADCGASELRCWLEHDHPGPIRVGDCIPGEPGVAASVQKPIQERVGDIVNIILWDEEECEIPSDGCPGTPYHVASFGCVEVVGWEQAYKFDTCGSAAVCKTLHAVRAVKICEDHPRWDECYTVSTEGSGDLPEDWELRTVTLVK